MSFVPAIFIMTLALTSYAASGSKDFESFDCYRDLCVNRQQFCSHNERRCKYCQPGNCLNPKRTPPECRPLCPELLNPSTTTTTRTAKTTETPTTTIRSSSKIVPGQDNVGNNGKAKHFLPPRAGPQENGIFVSAEILLIGVTVLAVILVALLGLIIISLYYIRQLHRRSPAAAPSHEEGGVVPVEEEHALLGDGWGSKSIGKMASSTSQAAMFLQPPKHPSTPAGSRHYQTVGDNQSVPTDLNPLTTSDLCPPYTARSNGPADHRNAMSTDDRTIANSLQQLKDYDFRVPKDQHSPVLPPPPPPPPPSQSSTCYAVVPAEGQRELSRFSDETCPRTV